MSKLKEIAQSSEVLSAIKELSNAQSITPTDNSNAFGGLMDKATSQMSDKNEENKDERDATEKALISKTAEKSKAGKKEAVKEGDNQDKESSEINDKEQEEIDAYKINVMELAQQLNVALDQIKAQTEIQTPQQNLRTEIKVIQGLTKVTQLVDAELIRKVDVETLRKQMELAMAKNEPIDLKVEVPKELPVESIQEFNLEVELPQLITANENQVEVNVQDLFKVEDINLDEILANTGAKVNLNLDSKLEAKVPNGFDNILSASADLVAQDEPDTVMKVVAVDLNALKVEKTNNENPALVPLSKFVPENLEVSPQSNILTFLKDKNIDVLRHDTLGQFNLSNMSLTAATAEQVFVNMSFLSPLKDKVSDIILQMSKNGKSGTTKIQLYPPEFGAINIKINVQSDKVKIEIMTDNHATKLFLENHISYIKDILMADKLEVERIDFFHDKDFFKPEKQGVLSQFTKEQTHHYGQQNRDANDAKREELEKLKNLVATNARQTQIAKGNIDVTI